VALLPLVLTAGCLHVTSFQADLGTTCAAARQALQAEGTLERELRDTNSVSLSGRLSDGQRVRLWLAEEDHALDWEGTAPAQSESSGPHTHVYLWVWPVGDRGLAARVLEGMEAELAKSSAPPAPTLAAPTGPVPQASNPLPPAR
jgi:hypothetical protein